MRPLIRRAPSTIAFLWLLLTLGCAGSWARSQTVETFGSARDPEVEAHRRQLFVEANRFRHLRGRAPLASDPALDLAAQTYAERMLRQGFFAHKHRGQGPVERALAAGYPNSQVTENLARNALTAKRAVELWRRSRGHRRNLLNPTASRTGSGYATGGDPNRPRTYWVQLYGQ